jgi:CubicO group peptidase (beta-lactamase class C family)
MRKEPEMGINKLLLNRIIALFTLSMICTLFPLNLVQANTRANGFSQITSFEEIDAYIEKQLDAFNIPGAVLAIVEGDQIVHIKGFGVSSPNSTTPTPQTPFAICSLTKSFTALAVMQLVEAGKIELDAPVQLYLPWFRLADPQAAAQITVRHLLVQSSGLSQATGWKTMVNFDDSPDASEKQARELASFKPNRPVGSAFEYSNTNYNLLGLIIEAASGEKYADYVQNHIFAPLDMTHTYTSKAVAKQNGMSTGYISWFGIPVAVPDLPNPNGSLPSGQIISSAEDIAHYLIAQLNGGRYEDAQILSQEGIAEMHSPGVDANSMGVDLGDYGMGWIITPTSQGNRIWHDGTMPDYFSYMALLPEHNRGMVLLVNANHLVINFALAEVGGGAASLLAGVQPEPTPWAVVPWSLRAFLIIPILQILGIFITLRAVRRWRKDASRRPGPIRKWIHIALPIVLNLILVACALWLITSGVLKFWLLYMPDLSWLALICGGVALVWIFVRTRLILGALQGSPSPASFVGRLIEEPKSVL